MTRLVGFLLGPGARYGDPLCAGVFALLWLTGLSSGGVPAGGWELGVFAVCGLLITVPFGWRRTSPVAVAWIVYGAGTALAQLRTSGLPIGFVLGSLLAAYSLGAYAYGRRTWVTVVLVWGAVTADTARHNDSGLAGVVLTPVAFVLVPWAVGRLVSRLRAERSALRQMTLTLEREQEDVARASVRQERARIARELHDIVAHSISVMVVQAGAAEQLIDPTNGARQPLEAIRATGHEALVEMRHLLGVLRTDDRDDLALAPQPGLAHLSTLVDAARNAGLEVTAAIHGVPALLPPGVDVAAYRVVQESLSNIRKHACGGSATVVVSYQPTCLSIEIQDDGIGARDGIGAAGHGLIGMRERVALYSGRLECGPTAKGGWRVWAALPLSP